MLEKNSSEEFKRLKYIVEHADFKEPRDVEEFFEAYTKYIWNYKMFGSIYDCYPDNISIKLEGGIELDFDQEVDGCIWAVNALPDRESKFIDIMAHKVDDETFKFVQVTTLKRATSLGPSMHGPATGKVMNENNVFNMCECLVKKVNGRWIIADEWVVDSKKRYESVFKGYDF